MYACCHNDVITDTRLFSPSLSSSGAGAVPSPRVEAVEDFLPAFSPARIFLARMTARVTMMDRRIMASTGTHPIITMTSTLMPDPVPKLRPLVGSA